VHPDIPAGLERKLDPVLPELPFRNLCSLPFRRPLGEKGTLCFFKSAAIASFAGVGSALVLK